MSIQSQLQEYRAEAAEHKATWLANKEKTDRKSRKDAREAAERLEFCTDKIAMLAAMAKSKQFRGQ